MTYISYTVSDYTDQQHKPLTTEDIFKQVSPLIFTSYPKKYKYWVSFQGYISMLTISRDEDTGDIVSMVDHPLGMVNDIKGTYTYRSIQNIYVDLCKHLNSFYEGSKYEKYLDLYEDLEETIKDKQDSISDGGITPEELRKLQSEIDKGLNTLNTYLKEYISLTKEEQSNAS